MDKDNKYYEKIKTLIENHKKYLGLELILEDIIDDVYSHSEVIINTVKNESVIEAYLSKVVSTSIITVPKKLNFRSTVKMSEQLSLQQTMAPVKVNNELVDKMINGAAVNAVGAENIVSKAEQKINKNENDEADSINMKPQIIEAANVDGEIDSIENDLQEEFVIDNEENLVIESVEQTGADNHTEENHTLDTIDLEIKTEDEITLDDAELTEHDYSAELVLDEEAGITSSVNEQEIGLSSTEQNSTPDFNDEYKTEEMLSVCQNELLLENEEQDNDNIDDNNGTIGENEKEDNEFDCISLESEDTDIISETASSELALNDSLEAENVNSSNDVVLDFRDSAIENSSDEFELNNTGENNAVSLQEDYDGFSGCDIAAIEPGNEVLTEGDDLDLELDASDGAVEQTPGNDDAETHDELNQLETEDNGSLSENIGEFADNFSLEGGEPLEEELLEEGSLDDDFNSTENDLDFKDVQIDEFDTDNSENIDIISESDTDILVPEEADIVEDNISTEFPSTDYSKFEFTPSEDSSGIDYESIAGEIRKLAEKTPDIDILEIYNLKYKENLTVADIVKKLELSENTVIDVLNEIIAVV